MATSTVRDDGNSALIGYQPPATPDVFQLPTNVIHWPTDPVRFVVRKQLAKPRIQRHDRNANHEEFEIGQEVDIFYNGIVDSWEYGYVLTSLLGNDGYSGGNHVWVPGSVTGANPQPLLSMMICLGGYDVGANLWEFYKFRNVRFGESRIRFDPRTGVLMHRSRAGGIYDGKLPAAKPTYNAPGKPMANAGVVFSRNASVISPILSGEILLRNAFGYQIGSPAAAGSGALIPTRLTEGDTSGRIDVVYDSRTNINADFDAFVAGTEVAWTLVATERSGTETLTIAMPRAKYDTGEVDPTNADHRQHAGGDLLTSSGSFTTVTLTGPKEARYDA